MANAPAASTSTESTSGDVRHEQYGRPSRGPGHRGHRVKSTAALLGVLSLAVGVSREAAATAIDVHLTGEITDITGALPPASWSLEVGTPFSGVLHVDTEIADLCDGIDCGYYEHYGPAVMTSHFGDTVTLGPGTVQLSLSQPDLDTTFWARQGYYPEEVGGMFVEEDRYHLDWTGPETNSPEGWVGNLPFATFDGGEASLHVRDGVEGDIIHIVASITSAVVIPEPSTGALIGLGVLGLGLRRRRRL